MKREEISHFRNIRRAAVLGIVMGIACLVFSPVTASAQSASQAQATGQEASLPFLDPLFTSNMVLQRDMSDAVWGWTKPGASVAVSVAGKSARAVAGPDGKWLVKLPRLPTGGPYTLTATATESEPVTLTNVMVGDVWLCSGQSNMEYGIGNVTHADQEIATADYPQIRLFYVPEAADPANPHILPSGGTWDACTPDTVRKDGDWNGFSAVGYFFGRDLYQKSHVPLGLISVSVGGTPAETWTSRSALEARMPEIAAQIGPLTALGKPKPGQFASIPSEFYNTMINPLIPFGIKGVVWYQGESNDGAGYAYRTLLPTMIEDWRSRWMQGSFPFLLIQLAGWGQQPVEPGDNSFAEMREAQALTAKTVPKTYMATAIDVGEQADIHYHNKQEVGRRAALVALREVYRDQSVTDSGPVYLSMIVKGAQVKITFANASGGLVEKGSGPIVGFAVADTDRKWHWADATIDGDNILLSSPDVSSPVAVRYAWAAYLPLNLYNRAGLPVYPFRTDNWKLLSQP